MHSSKAAIESVHLQERDISLLRGLFESRVMTAIHISALYFNGKREAAKKRLQKLMATGFIAQRPRKKFEAAVYSLSQAGLEEIGSRGILKQYPAFDLPVLERRAQVSDLTLGHELEVMDVKVSICRAMKNSALSLIEFTTWPLLNQFNSPSTKTSPAGMVRPDGFMRVADGSPLDGDEMAFFIELDRSTESQTVLVSRANRYFEHYRSGRFALRNTGKREEFRKHPFRVLYILKTAERRNNTIERLLRNVPSILALVWLTTIDEVTTNPLDAIWMRPVDYREALKGSDFDLHPHSPGPAYKRRGTRDSFVQRNVVKRTLISEKATPEFVHEEVY